MGNGKKNSNIWFFQKFPNFSHMVWVVSGPAWGCCFTSIKVCSSHTNSLRKSKKTAGKLLFSRPSSKGVPQAKNSNFCTVFFDFLKEFVCDEQTFIEVKQHPQVGPETTHNMCEKFENFLKNRFFDFFLTFFVGGPLTELVYFGWFSTVFVDFLEDFVSDEQTFIEAKQHPQAGPETTHIMCVKYGNFLKNQFFYFFWTNFHGPPHDC